jgi:drug/metabolite transporter (DMT)-like permease
VDLRSDRAILVAFVVGSVLGGGNAVGVRFSNRELEPLWGAGLRFAFAALVLLAIGTALKIPRPQGRQAVGAAIYGLLNFAAAFAFAYYGLQKVHAGFGQILLSTVPLATILLAVLERREAFRWAALIGGLIAVAGVIVMSPAALDESVPVLSILAMLGASLCFAQAAIVIGWFPRVHPVHLNTYGMATGALALFLGSFLAGEVHDVPELGSTWVALGYLVFIGSVVVFVLYVYVIENWGASRASYALVLVAPFTVVFSWWLLDEPVGWSLLAGGALVLLGVYVGALRRKAVAPS